MDTRRHVIPLFIVAALLAIALLITNKSEQQQADPVITVRTATLSGDLPIRRLQISGTTQSAETAMLRFQVAGRVTEKRVRLGEIVSKGAVLARLYNPEFEPMITSAKENLARFTTEMSQLKRDFARVDVLYQQRAVTLQEWEIARTRLIASEKTESAAKSELNRATKVASELSLVAPFDGVVTDILIDVGEVLMSGSPAIRLSNPDLVELKLAVSDTILGQVKLGQLVQVNRALRASDIDTDIEGIVSEISPHRERGSLPEIIVRLNAAEIGPGIAVNAKLEVLSSRGLNVPMRSVLMTGEDSIAVYRVSNGIANLVPIRALRISTNSIEIDQGLDQGDAVVIEGVPQLFDGAKVIEASTTIENNEVIK